MENAISHAGIERQTNPFRACENNFKVAVLGAAGGVGQPLGLLLKLNPRVTDLAMFDVAKLTPGVALDLSHINTCSIAQGYTNKVKLFETLSNASVIVLASGKPRNKPEMSLQELFKCNADVYFDVMRAIVCYAPCSIIAVVGNPVNSLVPMVSEFMMKACLYDPRRVFGVTTLDMVRSSKFVAIVNRVRPPCQYVPVVGGHDGPTTIPLLSQSCPPFASPNQSVIKSVTDQVQTAGNTVLSKKVGTGSGTLACAHAAARFVDSLLKGLMGEIAIECAYVRSNVTAAPYFASPVVLGRCGMESNLGLGQLSAFEKTLVDEAVPLLQQHIDVGYAYIKRREKHIPLRIN